MNLPFPMAKQQAERVLAASPVAFNNGAQPNQIFLVADQDMLVDLSRLCLTAGATGYNAPPGAFPVDTSPTSGDLSGLLQITSILVKQTTELVRGQAAPGGLVGIPYGAFSPYRDYTPFRLTGVGDWLALSAQEAIAITFQDGNNFGAGWAGVAYAAAPCVLFCDKGEQAYPSGFSQKNAAAVMGAQTVNNAGVGGLPWGPNGAQFNLVHQAAETGILDISQIQIMLSDESNGPNAANFINEETVGLYTSALNQVTRVDRSLLIQGVDTSGVGAGLAAPLGMFASPGPTSRGNPWVRYQAVRMGNGNTVQWQVTKIQGGGTVQGIAGAPFYPSTRSKPPLGCI